MARNEADREDLMAEAVSLLKRIEFHDASQTQPVVAGLNTFGWLFVYLGQDTMYRFDELGRLRRAFVDGLLYRTEGRTLAVLQRQRSSSAGASAAAMKSELLRKDLTVDELNIFQQRTRHELKELCDGMTTAAILRQVPEGIDGVKDEIQHAVRRALDTDEFLAPPLVRR
jgi:hypothetical protein